MTDENGTGIKYVAIMRTYRDAVQDLPPLERLAFYEAIMTYGLDGIEPQLSGTVKLAWQLIKPTVDSTIANFKKSSRGGQKGKGVARNFGNQNATRPEETIANQKQNNSKSIAEQKQNESKTIANQKQINSKTIPEKEKEKEIEKETEKEIETEKEKETGVNARAREDAPKPSRTTKRTIGQLQARHPKAVAFWQAVRAVYPSNLRRAPSEGILQIIDDKKLWERQDEIVATIKRFTTEDDNWRRGYAPAMPRFFEEERYENEPTPPKPPETVRKIFTTQAEMPHYTDDSDVPELP